MNPVTDPKPSKIYSYRINLFTYHSDICISVRREKVGVLPSISTEGYVLMR